MTQRLVSTSPRLSAAIKFGELLSRTMAAREVGQGVVKDAAGVSRASIVEWRNGRNLPTLESALRIAEALNEPRLAEIVRLARTVECERCRRGFVNEQGLPKRYCSAACRTLGAPGPRHRRSEAEQAVMILRGEMLRIGAVRKQQIGRALTKLDDFHAPEKDALAAVDAYQDAVAGMCASCEPDGLCRTAECPLRGVSPLPLISNDVDVESARKPLGRWGRPELHDAHSQAMRERHAADPEWRRQSGERMREAWAELGPAERSRRMSEARRRGIEARKAVAR